MESTSSLLNVHERPADTTPSSISSFLDTLVASSDALNQTLRQQQQEQLSTPPDKQSDDILQRLVSEAFPSKLHAFLRSLEWAADQQPHDVRVKQTLQNVLQSLKHLLQPPTEYSVEEIFSSPSACSQQPQPQQQQQQQQQQQRSQKRTDAHALSAQAFSAELVCSRVLTALVTLAFNKIGLVEGEGDAGPASLLHVVATEALDACIDASGGAAMSQHIDDHFAQALTQAVGGAEQAQRLLQCVRAAERHAAAEHQVQEQQQQQQQQPLDDTFEPATAAVLFGVASGLDDQGHAAMQALLQAQPSLVFWRLCLRAYACLQGVCLA